MKNKTNYTLLQGDVNDQFKLIPSDSVDCVITDPPYNLGMDKWDKWDSNVEFGKWCHTWAVEAYRVLKPGGHIAAFGANKTYHWLATGIETAGFIPRDMIEWVYWSTMPRGTNLKSCHEPIFLASKGKPVALNVEDMRVPHSFVVVDEKNIIPNLPTGKHPGRGGYGGNGKTKKYGKQLDSKPYIMNEHGRHPYNIITENMAINVMDIKKPRGKKNEVTSHPTQKPTVLIEWLVGLLSKEGDIVVDCFAGSGTTAVACVNMGRYPILIERNEAYIEIIQSRIT